MRILAILAAYNERIFIQPVIRHLAAQGVETYLIDNDSTDGTLDLARQLEGNGLAGWERLPREGVFEWSRILRQKMAVADRIPSDWYLHSDCDEFRLPPTGFGTMAEALDSVDRDGFNAVNFEEFTFIPVREAPHHEHADFLSTMRWYYCFEPFPLHRLNAWKRPSAPIDLLRVGGHQVDFPDQRIAPIRFRMRHYVMLSLAQAHRKYDLHYSAEDAKRGWFGWRNNSRRRPLLLPPARALMTYHSDAQLVYREPLTQHILGDLWEGKRPQFPNDPGWRWRLGFAWQQRRSPHAVARA